MKTMLKDFNIWGGFWLDMLKNFNIWCVSSLSSYPSRHVRMEIFSLKMAKTDLILEIFTPFYAPDENFSIFHISVSMRYTCPIISLLLNGRLGIEHSSAISSLR